MSVLIDTVNKPTKVLQSWAAGPDAWTDLPTGRDVVRVDGPGTSHPRARHGEGMYYHDEYVWLPQIELESFICSFTLELETEVQAGCPRDVGRHGGVALGVSKPYTNVYWPRCPRNDEDGVWIGYLPEGGLGGKAFSKKLEPIERTTLQSHPSEWVIEVNHMQLQVTIDGKKVIDCETEQSISGYLGFWRARSGHKVIVHNLVVERSGTATVSVAFPAGIVYDVEVMLSGSVLQLREGAEKQHEIPAACILKLFQDWGDFLLDEDTIKQIDTTQPVFGVVARETKLEVLLQACGNYWRYQDAIQKAAKEAANPKTQVAIPPLPDIITVLTEMGGQAPDLKNLSMGEEKGSLVFSGRDGDLILPSIDAAPLLAAAGIDKFAAVTMCIELNCDAYNQGLGVVLEASPLMDSTVDDSGLPSYIYNGYGVSRDKKQNAIKFHPGMHGGELRIEGAGGWSNSDIGFKPENWTKSGNKYHTLELTVRADGNNEMCIKGTQEGQEWRKPWTRQLTAGRYFPAIYAWLDLGSTTQPLHIRNISMTVHMESSEVHP